MKNLLKKCNGKLVLEKFDTRDVIKEAKWIYAVLYCSRCKIVINLFKKSELTKKQLDNLKCQIKPKK